MKKQKISPKKDKIKINKPLKEVKLKSKDFIKKNQQSATKSELNSLKSFKTLSEIKNQYKKGPKNHNSISSKEEAFKKNSSNEKKSMKIKQNKTNYNSSKFSRFISSKIVLTKTDKVNMSKEKEKIRNNDDKDLHQLFKKNFLKQTIIIDDEGNNNLNLNLKNIDKNDFRNLLNLNHNKNKIINSNNNSISFNENTETNSLFESSHNYINQININKENDIKQTIMDKDKEEKRLNEYNRIFNLLNSNIEQLKKLFKSNNNNEINNENKEIISKKTTNINFKNKFINNCKDKDCRANLKKNLSEKTLRSSINSFKNKNLFCVDINNNNPGNIHGENGNQIKNNNLSFLESCSDNEFYQSLINQTFLENISRPSFALDFDEISNIEKNKNNKIKYFTENNNKQMDNNFVDDNKENDKCRENTLKKKNSEKFRINKNSNENNQIDIQNFLMNFDKANCYIF